uniref:Uncharacterized protein n=1 Tax=Rhizophagus irregularis (strain DAOM 181602 / DAOM 197198 / MUCL 43194) TaxID=747089 RepID=U9SJG4_RHIID
MSASAKWFRQNGPLGEMSFGEKDFQRKVRIPLKSTMSRCFCFSFLVIFKNFLITQSFEKFMAYYKVGTSWTIKHLKVDRKI